MNWVALAGSLVALAMADSSIVKANTITTFNVEQPALLVFPSPGGQVNITGTLTIDVTAGVVTAANIHIPVSGVPDLTFIEESHAIDPSRSRWRLGVTDVLCPCQYALILQFTTPSPGSLVDFAGGSITEAAFSGTGVVFAFTEAGTIAAASVPTPIAGAGLPGLMGLMLASGRLLGWLRRRRA